MIAGRTKRPGAVTALQDGRILSVISAVHQLIAGQAFLPVTVAADYQRQTGMSVLLLLLLRIPIRRIPFISAGIIVFLTAFAD